MHSMINIHICTILFLYVVIARCLICMLILFYQSKTCIKNTLIYTIGHIPRCIWFHLILSIYPLLLICIPISFISYMRQEWNKTLPQTLHVGWHKGKGGIRYERLVGQRRTLIFVIEFGQEPGRNHGVLAFSFFKDSHFFKLLHKKLW